MGVGQTNRVLDTPTCACKGCACMPYTGMILQTSSDARFELLHSYLLCLAAVQLALIKFWPLPQPLWCCTSVVNPVIQVSLLEYDEPF